MAVNKAGRKFYSRPHGITDTDDEGLDSDVVMMRPIHSAEA